MKSRSEHSTFDMIIITTMNNNMNVNRATGQVNKSNVEFPRKMETRGKRANGKWKSRREL